MSDRMMDLGDRVMDAMAAGDDRVAQIAARLNHCPRKVSAAIKRLQKLGAIKRSDNGGARTNATWGLVAGAARPSVSKSVRNAEFRALEDEYIERRRNGEQLQDLQASMGLSATAIGTFERRLMFQTVGHNMPDSSTPKFAHHDLHLRLLAEAIQRGENQPRRAA